MKLLPNGGYIQKNYDYGYMPPKEGEKYEHKHFGIAVYRITLTNPDGNVHEFSAREGSAMVLSNGIPRILWIC